MGISNDVDELAYDFVYEYLDREPEIMDVSEFIWDNAEGGLEVDEMDGLTEKVFQAVLIKLSKVRDKF